MSVAPPGRPDRRGWLEVVCRLGALAGHLLLGSVRVIANANAPAARRLAVKQVWSRRLLELLGIQLECVGDVVGTPLLVANHVSWIDVFVVNAVAPAAFVAKAEIRDWPLFGRLAAGSDTLFIDRGHSHHVRHVAHEMVRRLTGVCPVAVFPEGTTSDGRTVLPFRAALFQAALTAGAPIQPLAIAYLARDGQLASEPAYDGARTLWQTLRETLAARGLRARVICLPCLPANETTDRRSAAERSRRAIIDALAASPVRPGTLPD